MIAYFFKISVKPGKKEELLEFMKWDCQVARDEEPHVLRFDVFADADDESVIYYYEACIDEAGFEKHKSYPPFQQWTNGLRDECIESTEGLLPVWSTAVCTTAEQAESMTQHPERKRGLACGGR